MSAVEWRPPAASPLRAGDRVRRRAAGALAARGLGRDRCRGRGGGRAVVAAGAAMSDAVPWSIRWLRWALGAVAFVVIVEAARGFRGATRAALPVIGGAAAAAGALAVRAGWRAARRHERGDALEAAGQGAREAVTVGHATR